MLEYIVVGTGRSGTGYMSRLLKVGGIPCGHESVFGLDTHMNYIVLPETNLIADSSWLAVPFLGTKFLQGVKIIHAVRHPLDVISSFLANNLFSSHDGYQKYMEFFSPQIKTLAPLDAAVFHYVKWNTMILQHTTSKYIRFRVEDPPQVLFDALKKPCPEVLVDRTYNTRNPVTTKVTIDEITFFKNELVAMAKKFGYTL